MSYDDTGGSSGYGGGDYDYYDYDKSGHCGDTTIHDTPAHSSINMYAGNEYDAMSDFLKNALSILINYEKHICSVKQRPYNLEIYEIDKRAAYLRNLANKYKKDSTQEVQEVQRIENTISRMREERKRLQSSESTLNVEKIESINLRKLYIKKRFRFCDKNSEDYRPEYDPRLDPELQNLIDTAINYEDEYSEMLAKESEFSKLNEHIEKLIEDYGLPEVQRRVKSMINPYSWH